MTKSFCIDFKNNSSKLCDIGAKYDVDQSSQRKNVRGDTDRHCHAYSLFYHSLFKKIKNKQLCIAHLSINSSLLVWQEYFKKSTIYGFDNKQESIHHFQTNNYNKDRINLSKIDLSTTESIAKAFKKTEVQYDIIIDDITFFMDEQVRVIESVQPFLKPGGIIISEDIFKSHDENMYIEKLDTTIFYFQNYYFVTIDHVNRCSGVWNNDKLFVLIKDGESILSHHKKITIITPCSRPDNLTILKNSIDFDFVNEWIIVYDGKKVNENPYLFKDEYEDNSKIKEYIHSGNGMFGNPQRNYALDNVSNEDTYLYFLDDDNIMHPNLFDFLTIVDNKKIYTFNQESGLSGNEIEIGKIDTAMMLIDFRICKDIRWIVDEYIADGLYIKECYESNKDKWIYVNTDLCHYNYL
jgi:hypothetical protein